MSKIYVVIAPPEIRGIYTTWAACQEVMRGVSGAYHQKVSTLKEATSLLNDTEVCLKPGRYAFIDGNHLGGIGVVLVEQHGTSRATRTTRMLHTTVHAVLQQAMTTGLVAVSQPATITEALARLRNVYAELCALLAALSESSAHTALTVVYDYQDIDAWFHGSCRVRHAPLAAVVAACRVLAESKHLILTFRHQRGHASCGIARHDYAALNALADRLATHAVIPACPTTSSKRLQKGAQP